MTRGVLPGGAAAEVFVCYHDAAGVYFADEIFVYVFHAMFGQFFWICYGQISGRDDYVGVYIVSVFEYFSFCLHRYVLLSLFGNFIVFCFIFIIQALPVRIFCRLLRWRRLLPGLPGIFRNLRVPSGLQSFGLWWIRSALPLPGCPCSRPGRGRRWGCLRQLRPG